MRSVVEVLGMKMNDGLTWKEHIASLKVSLDQGLGLVKRLSHCIPKSALKPIADGLFLSRVRYGLAVYGKPRLRESDMSNTLMSELQVKQNRMMRLLTGNRLKDKVPVHVLLEETGWPSINQMIIESITKETWKVLNILDAPQQFGMKS